MDLPLKSGFFLRKFIDLHTPKQKTAHFCHEGGKLMAQGEIKVGQVAEYSVSRYGSGGSAKKLGPTRSKLK